MDELIRVLDEYCGVEFNDVPDISDPYRVGILYTTVCDNELGLSDDYDEHDLQIDADLVHAALLYYMDNELYETEQYSSQEDMAACLHGVTFNDLYSFAVYLYRERR